MALTYDPARGVYVDPATGATYQATGAGAVGGTDPGLRAQQERSLAIGNQLYGNLANYGSQYGNTYARQTQLGNALDAQIQGRGPSVVQNQLYAGLDAIRRNQDSQAAGATGANAALGRYAALTGTGEAQAQANQAGALARTQEQSDAMKLKAGLLGQQSAGAQGMYGNTLQGVVGVGNTASGAGQAQAQIDQKDRERMQNFYASLINTGGNALTQYAISKNS